MAGGADQRTGNLPGLRCRCIPGYAILKAITAAENGLRSARREGESERPGQRPGKNAIVPALWISLRADRLPSVAQAIQYHHADLRAAVTRTEGFYGIMKLEQWPGLQRRPTG